MSRLIDVFSSLDHELERTRAKVDSAVAETFLFREQYEVDMLARERREREILRCCLMLVNEKKRQIRRIRAEARGQISSGAPTSISVEPPKSSGSTRSKAAPSRRPPKGKDTSDVKLPSRRGRSRVVETSEEDEEQQEEKRTESGEEQEENESEEMTPPRPAAATRSSSRNRGKTKKYSEASSSEESAKDEAQRAKPSREEKQNKTKETAQKGNDNVCSVLDITHSQFLSCLYYFFLQKKKRNPIYWSAVTACQE